MHWLYLFYLHILTDFNQWGYQSSGRETCYEIEPDIGYRCQILKPGN